MSGTKVPVLSEEAAKAFAEMQPYRSPVYPTPMAEEPLPICGEIEKVFAGGGHLRRTVRCPFPSGLSMWWHNVKTNDEWKCHRCDTIYRYDAYGNWVRK
jgi:hypothetical protein